MIEYQRMLHKHMSIPQQEKHKNTDCGVFIMPYRVRGFFTSAKDAFPVPNKHPGDVVVVKTDSVFIWYQFDGTRFICVKEIERNML